MFIHQGLVSSLALGHLTRYLCSWRKGRPLSQLQIDMEPDDLRSWQALIFSQEERILSTQEAIISIQEIVFLSHRPFLLLLCLHLWQQLIFCPAET